MKTGEVALRVGFSAEEIARSVEPRLCGLTMPRESKILDAHGKPLITQLPVRVDPDAPIGMVYLIRTTPRHVGESDQDYVRHFGIITNVKLP